MQILLGESDAFLHTDKQARMIIIHVTFNSGKKVQFPYPADKPISAIYDSVSQISDENILVPVVAPVISSHAAEATPSGAVVPLVSTAPASSIPAPSLTGREDIGREDFVKCIKVEPRGEGATVDIEVGKIYRVLKVHGPVLPVGGKMQKIIDAFDIVDDNSDTPRRIYALPSEVEFYAKRKPAPVKTVGKFESTFVCPNCQQRMVAYKEQDGKYHGECMNCLQTSEHELNAKPSTGTSVTNEPSGVGASVSTGI